jgi:outer membrane protein OmpA-like peptidoglycan-associated protein
VERAFHIVFLLMLTGLGFPALAQLELESGSKGGDVIVFGREDGSEGDPVFQAIWRNVPGAYAEMKLQRTSAPAGDHRLMLDKLMESALGAYLDERIHFSKQGVNADLPAQQLALEMNAMIFSALEELGASSDMSGLSPPTREQLARLVKIDWSNATFGIDGGDDQDKYLAIYYYVRSQREELERQIRADLLPLASIAVLGAERSPVGQTVPMASTCGTVYDEQNYLCAIDLQLADTGGGGIDPELGAQISASLAKASEPAVMEPAADEARVRKRDRWLKAELDKINERMDKIDQRKELWELRDRMDDIDDRLTGLEMEVRDVRKGGSGDNPLASLSDLTGHNITVRFMRNSTEVDPEYRVLLNEVFEQLARSPQDRVLITGYTDRSGDPALNLKLSEQRAKSVRNYLLQRGIAAERLMVNYYGDSRSNMHDPSQRRVEVEWLQEKR